MAAQVQPEQMAKAVEMGVLPADPMSAVLSIQVVPYWVTPLLCLMMAIFAGGSTVADDMRMGTFQFYFARPLSREQYLVGKVVPVVLLIFFVCFGPSLILAVVRLAMYRSGIDSLGQLMMLPVRAFLLAALQALVLGVSSVAISSLSKRRGLVQGGYALMLLVPWIVGLIVSKIMRNPWPSILSVPSLLESVGTRLFAMKETDLLPWVPALVVLAAIVVGGVTLLRTRLAAVEVVAGS
jgi:ABC-2 type transport system permease protein